MAMPLNFRCVVLAVVVLVIVGWTTSSHAFLNPKPPIQVQSTPSTSFKLYAAEEYLDDLPNDNDSKSNRDDNDGSSTPPTYDYLEDASLKEPETYLEDMAGGGSISGINGRNDKPASPNRLEDVNAYLEDFSNASWYYGKKSTVDDDVVAASLDPDRAMSALLQLGAATGRGEFATETQKQKAADLIAALEVHNPTPEPTKSPLIYGRWSLLWSSTQLFRSSPFFMAGRAVCTTDEQAQQYDWFCDMHRKALAISSIGQVRQVVSPKRLTSEFEVQVGALPFLNDFSPFSYSGGWPVTIDGSIVSSAEIEPTDSGFGWELFMDTVEIKGSNIPFLRQVLDNGLMLTSRSLGSFLESNVDGYTNPKPVFETTYLSETLRISRDQDGKVFVYGKESDGTIPTDYSQVEADLGLLKLLEGFNDAVIKFYI